MKKLYLSREDRKILGVIGGLAEYFEVDSTLLRVCTVILAILTGFFPTILAYILFAILIPEKPLTPHHEDHAHTNTK